MITNASVAERLNALRVKTGINWYKISSALGISLSLLHQIKAGKRNASQKLLDRLAKLESEKPIDEPARPGIEQTFSVIQEIATRILCAEVSSCGQIEGHSSSVTKERVEAAIDAAFIIFHKTKDKAV